jgi:hypothetical protein
VTRKEKQQTTVNPYRHGLAVDVNASLPAGYTHADEVREIARQLQLEITSLPEQLSRTKFQHGAVLFGKARNYLDAIAAQYDGWEFEIADRELRVVKHGCNLSGFDELAGRLMLEARRKNRHLAPGEYERITAEIDRAGFKLADHLEGHNRELLRLWNRTNTQRAIHTFSEAFKHRNPLWVEKYDEDDDELFLRRAVQLRLNRALTKYREAHPHEARTS